MKEPETVRILQVDQDREFLSVTAEMLERRDESFDVVGETRTDSGLRRLRETHFDCVVSGFRLPDRDGLDFLATVRREHPELPTVLFAANPRRKLPIDEYDRAVSVYANKGFGTEQFSTLAQVIRSTVERYRKPSSSAITRDGNL